MASKTNEGSGASTNAAGMPANGLAEQLEVRSEEYLCYCQSTLPSAERHTTWSRLYAASQKLSQAVRENTVADMVLEIASNFMGCEEVAILRLDADYKQISFLSGVGVTGKHRHALQSHTEQLIAEIQRGQVRIVNNKVPGDELLASLGITGLIPLSQGHDAEGAIVFFNLLPQRQGFDSRDRELMGLLAIYVGPSLFAPQETSGRIR
jgi:hypothetical protein